MEKDPPFLLQKRLVVLPVCPDILDVALGLVRMQGLVAHLEFRDICNWSRHDPDPTFAKESRYKNSYKNVQITKGLIALEYVVN